MDLLGNMRNGTFVEIGGNDGLSTTNTYHLERCLGWQGLLIEGRPENFNKMVRARPGALSAPRCDRGYYYFCVQGKRTGGKGKQRTPRSINRNTTPC